MTASALIWFAYYLTTKTLGTLSWKMLHCYAWAPMSPDTPAIAFRSKRREYDFLFLKFRMRFTYIQVGGNNN